MLTIYIMKTNFRKLVWVSAVTFILGLQGNIYAENILSHNSQKHSSSLIDSVLLLDSGEIITVNSDLFLTRLIIIEGSILVINTGVSVTLNENPNAFDELTMDSGTITGAGVLKSNCANEHDNILVISENSNFDIDFKSISGRAVFNSKYGENYISAKKNITIDSGASMVYFGTSGASRFSIYGNILNNGHLWSGSGLFIFKGQSITNNDTIHADIELDTNCYVYGDGAWVSSYIYLYPNRVLTLGNNINFSIRNFTLLQNSKVNLNSHTLTLNDYFQYNYSDLLMNQFAEFKSGILKTKGAAIRLNMDTTAKLLAPLIVDSGNVIHSSLLGSTIIFDTSVTVSNAAAFNSGYNVIFKNDVLNNGYLNVNTCKYKGKNIINNGIICSAIFEFESDCNFSGSGMWTCGSYTYVKPFKTVTLQSDVKIRSPFFEIEPDAVLNTNGFSFILDHLDGTSGYLIVDSAAAVVGSGSVTANGFPNVFFVQIDNHFHADFSARINASSGLLYINDPSANGRSEFNNLLSVDSGATLSSANSGDSIVANGNVFNAGTLIGNLKLYGNQFTNNGIITSAYVVFSNSAARSSAQVFEGTGSFEEPSWCVIDSGATVNLNSIHQLNILRINSGGTFDISNQTLKIQGLGSECIVNNGNFVTSASMVEFNRQNNVQQFPVTNINYNNVTVNNPMGLILNGDVTLPALLILSNGDIDLNGYVITLTPSAMLQETPGNTVKGSNGYITTTRNINAPSDLNVAGMGAILTTGSNPGITEIRRGHVYQYGLAAGFQSIQRYFDISPANNTGLNAELKFRFDISEIDTLEKTELGLYSSTNAGLNYVYRSGNVDSSNNQIIINGLNSFSRWTAGLRAEAQPVNISCIIEAQFDVNTSLLNLRDSVSAYLANSISPYSIVDSAKSVVDSVNYTGSFLFVNAASGNYYIVVKHRNAIDTWSKSGGEFYSIGQTLSYNFTSTQSQAFGDNMRSLNSLWCLYSGDVNKDGSIDLTDIMVILNDANAFATGYTTTDLTGDNFVDLSDVAIAFNNATAFVSVIAP